MKSKEEILHKIKNFQSLSSLIGETGALQELYNAVEEYTSQDKWISVEDKLPEDYQRVLGYVEELNDLGISHFAWNVSYSKYHGFLDNLKPCRVTHWQPLPSPPKQITPCYNNYQ
jgi:hypothetical protein